MAQRYLGYNDPIGQEQEATDPKGETLPMELKRIIEWFNTLNHDGVTALFTVGIFVATAIYAVVAIAQWCAMRNSNEINRDALRSVQRAFVTFSPSLDTIIRITPQTNRANYWDFTIPMENSGVTPTKGMTGRANIWTGHDKIPDDFTFPDTGNSPPQLLVLGPKGKTDLGPIGVTPDIIEALESVPKGGSWHLYFYGWAKYRDIFEGTPEHVTKFCYELTSVAGDPWMPKKPDLYTYFVACPRHNCTDEECNVEK